MIGAKAMDDEVERFDKFIEAVQRIAEESKEIYFIDQLLANTILNMLARIEEEKNMYAGAVKGWQHEAARATKVLAEIDSLLKQVGGGESDG